MLRMIRDLFQTPRFGGCHVEIRPGSTTYYSGSLPAELTEVTITFRAGDADAFEAEAKRVASHIRGCRE